MDNKNQYDAEIKIINWIKKIKVNEHGDTININIGDNSLIKNLVELLNTVHDISLELNNEENKINDDNFIEKMNLIDTKTKEISCKLDELFGENTCIKVFNTITPYIDDIIDFLYQMAELISKFTGEKVNNLENIKDKFISKQQNRNKI